MIPIYVATEDILSEVVADRLVEETEGVLQIQVRVGGHGFGYLYRKRHELYTLSSHIPVLLLTDLDQKECAPSLVDEWFQKYDKPSGFLFRVVVREIEAWLLADKKGFSSFLNETKYSHAMRDVLRYAEEEYERLERMLREGDLSKSQFNRG